MPRPSRRPRALAGAGAVLALLVGLLTSCAEPDPGLTIGAGASTGLPLTKISVGIIPIIDVAPIYLGIQKGYFAQRGLDVRPVIAQTGGEIAEKVLAGQVDIGFSNVVSLLAAREKGADVIAVAAGVSSTGDPKKDVNGVVVGKGSPLRTAKDLEGKKVAVNALNNIGDTTVSAAVDKAGGDPSKVTFVPMPFPDMPAAVKAGTVDAAWLSEPFVSSVVAGGGRILFNNLTETYSKVQIAAYFTTASFREKQPVVLDRFVSALNDSLAYARDHQVQVREIVTTYTKIPREVAVSVNLPDWPVGLDEESLVAVGKAARRYGTLQKAPDVDGLVG
ncbi:MAG: ABC transporter substrate-binding protein [Actinobacteria bacterium]|nr:ABC transporter substrate-binding protein [Actinomycetota bacterium]